MHDKPDFRDSKGIFQLPHAFNCQFYCKYFWSINYNRFVGRRASPSQLLLYVNAIVLGEILVEKLIGRLEKSPGQKRTSFRGKKASSGY